MAVVKCDKGHFYDDVKYDSCPHCQSGLKRIKKETFEDDLSELTTRGLSFEVDPATNPDEDITVRLENLSPTGSADEGVTVGLYSFEEGTQLLSGWLVAVKGPARGRDYRLYMGWNRIGRATSMDIYIPEDMGISRENQGAVVFDEKTSKFFFVNGSGTPAAINGRPVDKASELRDGDKISIGESELVFIPFCTEERRWHEECKEKQE